MPQSLNIDNDITTKISDILREIEKYDSDGRNYRWQATLISKKIKDLEDVVNKQSKPRDALLQSEYDYMLNEIENLDKALNNYDVELDTLQKGQSYLFSEVLSLKHDLKQLFTKYSRPRSHLLENEQIVHSISAGKCYLCNAEGSVVISNIEKTVNGEYCPLCQTKIEENQNDQQSLLENIKQLDKEMFEKNTRLESMHLSINDKIKQMDRCKYNIEIAKKEIESFTVEHQYVDFTKTDDIQMSAISNQYKMQFNEFDNESKKAYKTRDHLKKEYRILLKTTEDAIRTAEQEFVPIFQRLAYQFIGVDLFIRPKSTDKGIMLILEFDKTARTEPYQLSESQRFFLDIALRMTLAIHLSKDKSTVTMLIDTPEGSLDIAYERRVGLMFARYCLDYKQNIFMISNINTSQLLVALAEECKNKNMRLRRMMDWTDLSKVHLEGESLFNKVYTDIENILSEV